MGLSPGRWPPPETLRHLRHLRPSGRDPPFWEIIKDVYNNSNISNKRPNIFYSIFFFDVEWFYYVPVSLAIILFWIIIIDYRNEQAAENVIKEHQELFSEEEQGMLLSSPSIFIQQVTFTTSFAKVDPNSALDHSIIISAIYGLVSLYFLNWPSLIICILVILFIPFTMRDSFYQGSENDEKHATSRYLKSKKINQKTITPKKMQSLSFTYHNILNKLQLIMEETP